MYNTCHQMRLSVERMDSLSVPWPDSPPDASSYDFSILDAVDASGRRFRIGGSAICPRPASCSEFSITTTLFKLPAQEEHDRILT